MESLFVSTGVVALAEIGDKTQLLALVLAARFRRPLPIVLGILVATIANHALAALVGREVAGLIESQGFRIAVALGFIAMAAWTLVPDKLDDDEDASVRTKSRRFLTTPVSFFFVEISRMTSSESPLGAVSDSISVTKPCLYGWSIRFCRTALIGVYQE